MTWMTENLHRHLGIPQLPRNHNEEARKTTYHQKVRQVLKSQLNGKNMIQAINTSPQIPCQHSELDKGGDGGCWCKDSQAPHNAQRLPPQVQSSQGTGEDVEGEGQSGPSCNKATFDWVLNTICRILYQKIHVTDLSYPKMAFSFINLI